MGVKPLLAALLGGWRRHCRRVPGVRGFGCAQDLWLLPMVGKTSSTQGIPLICTERAEARFARSGAGADAMSEGLVAWLQSMELEGQGIEE
jgi:hypothetical protein